MKKRFLTSLSLLAATIAADATAALPEVVAAKIPETKSIEQQSITQSPFVLDNAIANGGVFVADHYSHRSHSSHSSHRSHYSSR